MKGLGLRVTPSGKRVYVLKYRTRQGEQRFYTIGKHGSPWTPELARAEAKRIVGEVVQGADPAAEKMRARKAATFCELVEMYFAGGVAHKKPRTIKTDKGRARLHLIPLLGKKRVEAVTRDDIEHLLVAVINGKTVSKPTKRKRGGTATGGRGVGAQCVALASAILQFAVNRKMITANVAKGVRWSAFSLSTS